MTFTFRQSPGQGPKISDGRGNPVDYLVSPLVWSLEGLPEGSFMVSFALRGFQFSRPRERSSSKRNPGGLVMRLVDFYKRWKERRTLHQDLNALGQDGRRALARDLCVPEDVLNHLPVARARAGQELPRLMGALSLDPKEVERRHWAVMRDMSVTCISCTNSSRCRRDLERGRARSTFERNCPNAATLNELRREVPLGIRAA